VKTVSLERNAHATARYLVLESLSSSILLAIKASDLRGFCNKRIPGRPHEDWRKQPRRLGRCMEAQM